MSGLFKSISETIKQFGALLTAITIIWGIGISGLGAMMVYAQEQILEESDKRYLSKQEFAEFKSQQTNIAACQYAEAQKDQIKERLRTLDDKTPEEVRDDYEEDLRKHQNRYDTRSCGDVLDAIP